MFELTAGNLPREPNPISVYLRQQEALSIQPIPEVFLLESGSISQGAEALFPLAGFQTALILKSIWVSTPGTRERDGIVFQVKEGTTNKFRLTLRERDMPVVLPLLVVVPQQTLSITPQQNVDGIVVFASQCAVVYRTPPP